VATEELKQEKIVTLPTAPAVTETANGETQDSFVEEPEETATLQRPALDEVPSVLRIVFNQEAPRAGAVLGEPARRPLWRDLHQLHVEEDAQVLVPSASDLATDVSDFVAQCKYT